MSIEQFILRLKSEPEKIQFTDTMQVIDDNYHFTPTEFINGDQVNEANQNNGSCKLISFSKMNQLSVEQTLQCFGDYYRIDVLQHPENDDHQNIRNLMVHGWEGINFKGQALTEKA